MTKTVRQILAIAFAPAAIFASACIEPDSPPHGIMVSVSCSGIACGQFGDLFRRAKHCTDSTVEAERLNWNVTLATHTSVETALLEVEAGQWCVDAFLDRDDTGTPTAGDVAVSSGDVDVYVGFDTNSAVTLVLNTSL